jgi:hypothetical protein
VAVTWGFRFQVGDQFPAWREEIAAAKGQKLLERPESPGARALARAQMAVAS